MNDTKNSFNSNPKAEIISVIRSLLRVKVGDEMLKYKEFQEFILSDRINFLKVSFLPESNKVVLSNNSSIKKIEEKEIYLTFHKLKSTQITLENFLDEVDIISSRGSTTKMMINEIDNNLIPKISALESEKINNQKEPMFNILDSFKEKIFNLEKKLTYSKIFEGKITEENFENIFCVEDEYDFWKAYSKGDNTNVQRNLKICGVLLKTEKYLNESYLINSENCGEALLQIIGFAEDVLQDVSIIPKINLERLRNFLDLAMENLAKKIGDFLCEINIGENSSGSLAKINELHKSVSTAFDRIEYLNNLFYNKKANQIPNKNSENLLSKVYNLLSDLLDVKSVYAEISKLLPDMNIKLKFTNLLSLNKDKEKDNNPSEKNPKIKNLIFSSAENIEKIKLNMQSDLEKYEQEIVNKLNEEIFANLSNSANSSGQVISILRDMSLWKHILSRPKILELTKQSREILFKDFAEYFNKLKSNFLNKNQESIEETISSIEKISNISPKISQIIWAHTLKQKIENCKKLSFYFKDIETFDALLNSFDKFSLEIGNFVTENLTDWQNEFTDFAINNNSKSLRDLIPKVGSDLIEVNQKTGYLNVNFSEGLFKLIQDVRILCEYGYTSKIPKEILQINEEGKKILKDAISLKQIANFYNTLSSQVIPSQKPMLVQCAKDFETSLFLLTERTKMNKNNFNKNINSQMQINSANNLSLTQQKNNSANNLDLENFVGLVQNAANDLTKEIRKLKKAHSTILDYITQLLNYDLITNKHKWKEILKKSRNIFFDICEEYRGEHEMLTKEWSFHWNFQLFKVLKIQYSLSLERYFEFVSEFPCEFLIKNKQLNLTPSKEDLKKSLFKELKNFISIPNLIKGFTDDADYFHILVDENTNLITNLYAKANEAFAKIENLQSEFAEILCLCNCDFENFVAENFKKIEDWKFNYDLLKNKKKELDKKDDYVKLDCFRVNLIPLKNFMDEIFEQIFEILGFSLKEKLQFSVKIVDDFVKDALGKMQNKASSMQEILIFKKNFLELSRKKFEIKRLCEETEEMNSLLIKISGQNFSNFEISNLEEKIENVENVMNSFSGIIEEQKGNVKKELGQKIGNLNLDLEKFYAKWKGIKLPENFNFLGEKDFEEFEENAKSLKITYEEWEIFEKEISSMVNECKDFEIEIPELVLFEKIKSEIETGKMQWEGLFDFNTQLENLNNEEWLSIRFKAYGLIQDYVINWTDKLKKREKKDFVYTYISKKLEKFKQSLNVYKYLIGDNFERDHWKSLFNLLKFDNKITKENLKFGNFIQQTDLLVKKANDIKDLYSRAQGEILIRNAMSELSAWFETAEFTFTEYINPNNNRKTPLIKDWKEILNEISEKQSLLISVKSSEYFKRFSEQIENYETKFANLDIWLQNLNLIQRKWVYLEPIFLRGALPKESGRFKKIDDEFRNILISLNQNLKVSTIFNLGNVKDTLEMLIDQLEKCQKALNDYLEEKRNKFARLYFLGDDDLLEFLAKSKDEVTIKSNLKKLFQGISLLKIEAENSNSKETCITNMLSAIGEKVELRNKIKIKDELENWLLDLTKEMKNTLLINLLETIKNFKFFDFQANTKNLTEKNFENLNTQSAQICNISEMVGFTQNAEEAIRLDKVKPLYEDVLLLIEKLSILQAQNNSNRENPKNFVAIKFFKMKNLMLDLIHNREILESLLQNKVEDLQDWYWFSQLKYKIEENLNSKNDKNLRNLKIKICDSSFFYTFEYQGSCQKLVHTPLTDKCYLTLTQALYLGYGGNPYGPAGTGKTESVKALGQAFGRQVLVFNCDEGIDFKAMGRIFIGLVKSGAWGCFDEFNRLLEEQLSAISTMIQIIQIALKQNDPLINLLNQKINVDLNSAIFVTLNPAGKGYGGRSKLPDNLKVLFRPIAMSVPDNQQIARTLLYAEGFKNADLLAKKLVSLFSLSKQSLSNQQHYDWGLRSLKTILTVANQQIQNLLGENYNKNKTENNSNAKITYEDEVNILIKAIRINILSKLTFEDSKILNLLLSDVFPGIKMSDISYEDLNKVLIDIYKEKNLEFIESQFKKVLQFHEACNQRMGVVLVGPGGCGKSTIWKLLKSAYEKLGQETRVHIINPKSISRNLLLGHMNNDTGEYTYGVLTKCAKEVEKENPDTKSWIICDGDIDPEWIEALNSVLDDNRLLTMQNGERINFGNNVNFIFESDDLKFASPATISRMGIIYMNQEDLDTKSIINSWIKKRESESDGNFNSNISSNLSCWFENYFYEIYGNYFEGKLFNSGFSDDDNYFMLKTTNFGILRNMLSLFGENNNTNNEGNNENIFVSSKSHFVNVLIKGLGANLNFENRKKLANEIYQSFGERPPNFNNAINNYYDRDSKGIKEYLFDDSDFDIKEFNSQKFNPLIKTPTVLNNLEIIKTWISSNDPFIIIGPEGCGKTQLIMHSISQIKACNISIINCTSQTTSNNIIQKLLQSCSYSNTSKGKALRPKDCQKIFLFLKDINLPKPDKYNTIQLISFLHQVVAYGGFYDENLDFIYLERIQIIASMNPSSTLGRYEITTRLTGNVRILYIDYPTKDELCLIYQNYLKIVFNFFLKNQKNSEKNTDAEKLNFPNFNEAMKKIANSLIEFYQEIKENFTIDQQRHFIFTPRDLTNFVQNILRYENQISTNLNLFEIFGYEIIRIFKDRLVTKENLNKFDKLLLAFLKKLYAAIGLNIEKEKIQALFNDILKNKKIFSTINSNNSSIFANTALLNFCENEEYKEFLEKGKMVFERDNTEIYLNFFEENLKYFKIIDRLISKTNSNLLLIGANSIGRKKSIKLISTNLQCDLITPIFTKDFNLKEFKKTIKDLYQIAGVEGRSIIFLIEEHYLLKLEMMEMVNSLLSSGEIPGLLNSEDIEGFLSNVVNEYKDQNEYRNLYDFFISRIRKFLKIVVILDHDNKEFSNVLSNNPALISKSNIVWFQDFEKDTLFNLAKNVLKDCEAKLNNKAKSKSDKNNIFDCVIEILIEIYYSTNPKNSQNLNAIDNNSNNNESESNKIISTHGKFIELLLTFKEIYFSKISNSSNKKDHLTSGVKKLIEAEKFVEELTIKSKKQNEEIDIKKSEANSSLNNITNTMSIAAEKRTQLENLSKIISEDKILVEENKQKVELELRDVLPEVEKAKTLIKKLDSSKLTELRAYFRQPILKPEVYSVLKAMLQLIGYSDLTSEGVKSNFGAETISVLANFDIKKLTKENFKKVLKIINDNPSYFERANVQRVNFALAQIAEYVNAIVKFSYAKENIRPLEQALEEAEENLNKSQKKIDKNLLEMKKIDAEISEFQEIFAKKTSEVELLKIEFGKIQDLIIKAKSLLMKLSNEKIRWEFQQNELIMQSELLPFNTCLASGFVCFLGFYNQIIRENFTKKWVEFVSKKVENFGFFRKNETNDEKEKSGILPLGKFMITESETLKFKSQGLPFDDLSLENAIAIQNSFKTALIIDPNSKAIDWFKKFIQEKNPNQAFECVSVSDAKLITNIELAIRFGKILLIDDLDSIEPFLVPILRKESFKQGPRNVMKLGDKIVDIHDKFKLFLSTRNSDIQISDNVLSSLTVVNFTVTKSGLESLLLGLTIDIEKPELEKKKNEILDMQDKIKIELADVEKKLLEELVNLEGNLLENKELVNSLEMSKDKSTKSEESLKNSINLSKEIDIKRDIYKPLSKLATVIFLMLQDCYKINPMYRFSLDDFIRLYRRTLKSVQERQKNPCKQEWEFLLGNFTTSNSEGGEDSLNKIPWLPEERKPILNNFQKLFPEICDNLNLLNPKKNQIWENLYFSKTPEILLEDLDRNNQINLQISSDKKTENFSKKNSAIRKLILIQILRPDRLESAMKIFLSELIAINSLTQTTIGLNELISEVEEISKNEKKLTPILFITTLGSDPSRELEDFATKEIGKENYIEISMGAGENDLILLRIKEALKKGNWICLKNLHLSISWLPNLEKEIKNFDMKNVNPNFKMFFTSESHVKFSQILLQISKKIAYETPPGVKKNLERIYQIWENNSPLNNSNSNSKGEKVQKISGLENLKSQALFSLAFVHALLQERRTYIPQGWIKFYEFSFSDLKVSAESLVNYLDNCSDEKSLSLIWRNIKGLIVNSFYGGRIDNEFDFEIMKTYIHKILDLNLQKNTNEKLLDKIPILSTSDFSGYISLISKFQENDDPDLFLLPSNVDRSVQRYVSSQVLNRLNSLNSLNTNVNLKFDKNLSFERLSPLINFWKSNYNQEISESNSRLVFKINSEDPINIFVKSEGNLIFELGKNLNKFFTEILNVFELNNAITPKLIKDCLSLLKGEIPENWLKFWDGPDLPLNFVKIFIKKLNAISGYMKNAIDDKVLNGYVNLSEFLHPEGFINSLRQKSARLNKIPIDEMEIYSTFEEGFNKKNIGAKVFFNFLIFQISGLFIQGSEFDGINLTKIKESSLEIIALPKMNLFWIDKKQSKEIYGSMNSEDLLEIPIYENNFREKFICKINLPIKENKSEAILKGIAICLDSI